ncbi:MAG TPA: AAA family ATPase [Candidatus Baltobacteraceae bacterium]
MNAKICAGPAGGGSARGLVRYIVADHRLDLSDYGDPAYQARRAAYDAVMTEALARPDRGVGVVWRPSGSDGRRPSAVYATNVVSFATADLEMDALAAIAQSRKVREPVVHFVFSHAGTDTARLTDEQIIRAAEASIGKLGLGEHAAVYSIHRDTEHAHVHVAVAAVHAGTLKVWERNRSHERLSHAAREVELEHGLETDHGLAMLRDRGLETERIEWATRGERKAWAIERQADAIERRTPASDNMPIAELATEMIAPRLADYADKQHAAGERLAWSDVHTLAARYGCELRVKGGPRTVGLGTIEIVRGADVAQLDVGGILDLSQTDDDRAARKVFFRAYVDRAIAEQNLAARITDDPSCVSRAIVNAGEATFTRDDIERYISERISDPVEVADLTDFALQHDASLRIISADTALPLMTTRAQQQLEQSVADEAYALASETDSRFDVDALAEAIASVEADKGFMLSGEQRAVLFGVEHRLSLCNGEAGSGKTTIMLALARYAAATHRPIVGLSTAELASRKLAEASGITSMNSTRMLMRELNLARDQRKWDDAATHMRKRNSGPYKSSTPRPEALIKNGAIIVLDETSMLDMKHMQQLTMLARKRNASIVMIGDWAQLPSISAGDAHRVVTAAANKAGAYSELTEVRRQHGDLAWMRNWTARQGRAIRALDKAAVEAGVRELAQHGVIEWADTRDDVIAAVAERYVASARAGRPAIVTAASRADCRDANDAIREVVGFTGTGHKFAMRYGVREFVAGDRIVFGKNDSLNPKRRKVQTSNGAQILNGHTGTVLAVEYRGAKGLGHWQLDVQLDDGSSARFDPRTYRHADHGYVVTIHKAQGQEKPEHIMMMSKRGDARLLHVAATRATEVSTIIVSSGAWGEGGALDELARTVAEHVAPSSDALLFAEVVSRSGGPDTIWAKNVAVALANDADPLRQMHKAAIGEIVTRRDTALAALADRVGEEVRSAPSDAARKAILRANEKQTRAILAAHETPSFTAWTIAQRQQSEHDTARTEQIRLAREQGPTRANNVSRTQHEHEREREREQTLTH